MSSSICDDAELRELFAVGSALATVGGQALSPVGPSQARAPVPPHITQAMLDRLTDEVHRIEATEYVIGDWTILEVRAGVDSRLRSPDDGGKRWSRAW